MKYNVVIPRLLTACGFLITHVFCAQALETSLWSERRARGVLRLPVPPLIGDQRGGAPGVAPLTDALKSARPEESEKGPSALLSLLNTENGSVRGIFEPPMKKPGAPRVILVQDVHRNPEAQQHIAEALRVLFAHRAVDGVALEGSWGNFSTPQARSFGDARAVQRAADHLFREGRISGPLHAALTAPGPIPPLFGVEDAGLYQANVEAFRQAAPRIDLLMASLRQNQSRLETEKEATWSNSLRVLDRGVEAYHQGAVSLGDHLRRLAAAVPVVPPRTADFLRILEQEENLDFEKADRERRALLEKLARKAPGGVLNELGARSAAHRAGKISLSVLYRHLKEVCAQYGISFQSVPSFGAYVDYVLARDRLDAENLFREIRRLEESAYAQTVRTEEERNLLRRVQEGRWRKKLADFSLTPSEWREHRPLPVQDSPWAPFEDFYRQAERRDVALARNVARVRGMKTLVLVAGGFHSEGVTRRLLAAGVPVVRWVPRFEKIDSPQGTAYLSLFAQEKTPIEQLFRGEKLFLAENQRVPFETIFPSLVAGASNKVPLKKIQTFLETLQRRRIQGLKIVENVQEGEGRVVRVEYIAEGRPVVLTVWLGEDGHIQRYSENSRPGGEEEVRRFGEQIRRGFSGEKGAVPRWAWGAALAGLSLLMDGWSQGAGFVLAGVLSFSPASLGVRDNPRREPPRFVRELNPGEISGKTFFIRTNFDDTWFDLSSDAPITDIRMQMGAETVRFLQEKGGKVVLINHRGRPAQNDSAVASNPELTTDNLALAFGRLLGISIQKWSGVWDGDKKTFQLVGENEKLAMAALQPGEVVMMENSRFDPRETSPSEMDRLALAREIAALDPAGYFVLDGFPVSHRDKTATVTELPRVLPALKGFWQEKEEEVHWEFLDLLRQEVRPPLTAVFGGAKLDKTHEITGFTHLLRTGDTVVLGGLYGERLLSEETIRELRSNGVVVVPPKDRTYDEEGGITDIGSQTFSALIESFEKPNGPSRLLFWEGPLGRTKREGHYSGQLVEFIAKGLQSGWFEKAFVSGGSTGQLARPVFIKEGVDQDPRLALSTGGGTSIAFFAEEGGLAGARAVEEQQAVEAQASPDARVTAALLEAQGNREALPESLVDLFPPVDSGGVNDLSLYFEFLGTVSHRLEDGAYEERFERRVREEVKVPVTLETALGALHGATRSPARPATETGDLWVLEQIVGSEDRPQIEALSALVKKINDSARGPVVVRFVTENSDLAEELKGEFAENPSVFVRHVSHLIGTVLSKDYTDWLASQDPLKGRTVHLAVGVSKAANVLVPSGGEKSEYTRLLLEALGKIEPVHIYQMLLIAEVVSRQA